MVLKQTLDRAALSFFNAHGEFCFEPGLFTVWLGEDCLHGPHTEFVL